MANGVRFLLNAAKYYPANARFVRENPGFAVPPRALAFDAYSAPDWYFYRKSGTETAAFLAGIAAKYLPGKAGLRVLEWGCGPGRVIRHIPAAFATTTAFGSDYNPETIAWCSRNIPEVAFSKNELSPPLKFEANSFDFVYSISVLTHLSEAVSTQWVAELYRVMEPGALLVITTNGDSFKPWFLPDELAQYEASGFVMRGQFAEGKKLFMAYHSPQYLREKLFSRFEMLEFAPAGFPHTGQDMSVLRKP